MRTNVYKDKILSVLASAHLLRISDIHARISDADYSTVYRNIKDLVSEGKVKKVVLGKNIIMYELDNDGNHHDHFLCLDCGDVAGIHVTSQVRSLLKASKCVVTDVVARGLCDQCNQNI